MSSFTVGDLITILKEFDPSTPILKSISTDVDGYRDIELTSRVVFCVRPLLFEDGYCDCTPTHPDSFDAVVL